MKAKVLTAILAATLLAGCSIHNGQYAYMTSKPVTLYDLQKPELVVAKDVSASSFRWAVLFIPLGRIPTIEAALNDMLTEHHGDYLKNVNLHYSSFQLMPWIDYKAWEVTGDVIQYQ